MSTNASTRVKVCGITRLQDAELAVELGAWALGMVLYAPSPRKCSLSEAQVITASLRRRVELCGVFVNAPMEEIVGVSEELGLTLLQLHGEEGPSFCLEAARRTGARIVKALQVSGPGDVQDAARYHTDFHLLDARSRAPGRERLRGGTGETFDWKLLAGRRSKIPLLLSGGLSPENVTGAIEQVRPFAVDTASATESSPGHKDPAKLIDFFAAVQRAAYDAPSEAQSPLSSHVESAPSATPSHVEFAPPATLSHVESAHPSTPSAEGTPPVGSRA